MHISELAIYPLKSACQVRVQALALTPLGPAGDRRWMLVDGAGRYITQRTHPRLCLLSATLEAGCLVLRAPGMPALAVQEEALGETLTVSIWDDTVPALAAGRHADAWCSDFLHRPVRLVRMPERPLRAVDPGRAGAGHYTAFSDGFPLLLVTQSSLDHLNARLHEAGLAVVDWRRFRPNLVIDGGVAPHAEDGWRRLQVGEVELELVKPCSRCVIPAIDPDTSRKEPRLLEVLRRYRQQADGRVYFGQNVIVRRYRAGACLQVGDGVEVRA